MNATQASERVVPWTLTPTSAYWSTLKLKPGSWERPRVLSVRHTTEKGNPWGQDTRTYPDAEVPRLFFATDPTTVSFRQSAAPTAQAAEQTSTSSPETDGANSVAVLRDLSGLTSSQIARLFGVSRRSVQNWIAGATMSPSNEERLSHLLAQIRPLGDGPLERRRKLLASSKGPSLLHQLTGELKRGRVIRPEPTSAKSLLGVD